MLQAAVALFAFYAILSVVYQFDGPLKRRLSLWDRLGLLPAWTFFAPRPGTFDYRIIFRDFQGSDSEGSLQELPIYGPPGFFRTVWNPAKYRQKCLYDCIQDLLIELPKTPERRHIIVSWSYVKLCEIVLTQPHSPQATHRQFAIVTSEGCSVPRKLKLIFESEKHKLQ